MKTFLLPPFKQDMNRTGTSTCRCRSTTCQYSLILTQPEMDVFFQDRFPVGRPKPPAMDYAHGSLVVYCLCS